VLSFFTKPSRVEIGGQAGLETRRPQDPMLAAWFVVGRRVFASVSAWEGFRFCELRVFVPVT
jgi:hypothetical protein